MARPLIGVCAAVEQASFGVWTLEPAVLLPLSYADSIERAGGMPALLPPDPASTESPDALLDRIDALVLGGGADIDPTIQDVEPHPETIGTNPVRDRFEMALAIRAMELAPRIAMTSCETTSLTASRASFTRTLVTMG